VVKGEFMSFDVFSQIQKDFAKLGYNDLRFNFIDDLILDAKNFLNEVATEKEVLVEPHIDNITVYRFDSRVGPTAVTPLDDSIDSIKPYDKQIKRILDQTRSNLNYTGSYDGKHVHMLKFGIPLLDGREQDYLVLITTPKFVKLAEKDKSMIIEDFKDEINNCNRESINELKTKLTELSDYIKRGYNAFWSNHPVRIVVKKAPIVGYMVVYFDEKSGPTIISDTDSLDKRIIDESSNVAKLESDISFLLNLTSNDDKKVDGINKFKIIGKKNGLYYHTIELQVPDQTHRGNNAVYSIVIVTESGDISDNMLRFNEDFFKKSLINFHNSLNDTLSESDSVVKKHINETKDKSFVIDKKIVIDTLKQILNEKIKRPQLCASSQ